MKEDSVLQNNFKKGASTLAVLTLLQKESMYGYQLVQTMEKISQGKFVLQEGTLYPVLYRLLEAELISGERVQVGKRMTRIYYTITPEGRAYLARIRKQYDTITEGVKLLLDSCGAPEDME